MTFETTAAGNKNGSTRPKGTNCLSLHDRTSLPVFFVGQYTGKRGRLQYGIFNKNRRSAGSGLHVSAMTNKNDDAGLGVLRAKWRRTFQPRFLSHRGNGLRRHTFFWLVRKRIQPLFLCAAKKKPLAVKRKRQRGISISPFAIPLKRPRRGLRPPSLDFPQGLACAEIPSDCLNAIPMRIGQTGEVVEILCGYFRCNLNGSSFVRDAQRSPCKEEAYRLPYVKYSTGANSTTRMARRALGKPDQAAARRAF